MLAISMLSFERRLKAIISSDDLHFCPLSPFPDLSTGKEGMVAKRVDSRYLGGRTQAWLKIKTEAGKKEMQRRGKVGMLDVVSRSEDWDAVSYRIE
jgi:hypothetical protein